MPLPTPERVCRVGPRCVRGAALGARFSVVPIRLLRRAQLGGRSWWAFDLGAGGGSGVGVQRERWDQDRSDAGVGEGDTDVRVGGFHCDARLESSCVAEL